MNPPKGQLNGVIREIRNYLALQYSIALGICWRSLWIVPGHGQIDGLVFLGLQCF